MNARFRSYLAALSLGLIASAFSARSSGFILLSRPVLMQGAFALALGTLALVYARLKRAPVLQLALEASFWAIVISSAFDVPMYLLVRHGGVFADAALSRWDTALGIDVPGWVHWATAHPASAQLLDKAYASLRMMSLLALLVPAIAGRAQWTSEFLLSLALSVVLTLLFLTRLRAIGPWVGGGFSPSLGQTECEHVLRAIDSGSLVAIDVSRSAPLIALPSWHVILAILSAYTLGRFPYARPSCVIWALLVGASTLTTGWHYGVDVLAGVLVAGVAIIISRRMHQHQALAEQRQSALLSLGLASRPPHRAEK